MKFNAGLFGGAVAGGLISGDTGDSYETLPTVVGSIVGGVAGSKMDFTLPSDVTRSVRSKVDSSQGVSSFKTNRDTFYTDISDILTSYSSGKSADVAFDPNDPLGSVSETNLRSALRYYNEVGDVELKKALLIMKEGTESFVKIDPNKLVAGYKPEYNFVTKGATLEEKIAGIRSHLEAVEFNNTPEANRSLEQHLNISKRVEELTPLLDRLQGNIIFEDGTLKSTLEGQSFTLPLTQTLGDGETLGHNINNNVYTSPKFNIMGAAIADGKGSTLESSKAVLDNLGLKEGTTAYKDALEMLLNKQGTTREGALGIIASSKGVTDKSLLNAIEILSEKKQWDEGATSVHLSNRVNKLNGIEGDFTLSPYTRTQSSLIDMSLTLKHGKGGFGDLSETVLRSVKTSTEDGGEGVESHKIRRAMMGKGEDRVSGVKADKSLLFTPIDGSNALFNINAPYSRNVGTITNRVLAVKGPANEDFNKMVSLFGAEAQMGSAVPIKTALFDEQKVADGLSRVFGGNITLEDGYAIGNKGTFSRFSHTGFQTVKLNSGYDQSISVRQPLMNNLLNGSLDLETLKDLSETHKTFRVQKTQTLREIHENYAHATRFFNDLDDIYDYGEVADGLNKRGKGLMRMLNGIHRSTLHQAEKKGLTQEQERRLLNNNIRKGVNSYFSKRLQASSMKQTTEYGSAILDEVNSILAEAVQNFDVNYMDKVEEALSHLDNQKGIIRAARQTVDLRGGQTVGFGLDGTAQKLSKSFDKYELVGLQQRVDPQGRVSSELIYEGVSNVADNHVIKTHSVNYKDQVVMQNADDFRKAGALAEMLDKDLIKNKGDSFTISGSLLESGQDYTGSIDDIKDLLGGNFDGTTKEAEEYLEKLSTKYKTVDSLTGRDNAGYKNLQNILKEIQGDTSSSTISTPAMETINEYDINLRKNSEHVKAGLADFVYATSNEKPSTSALAEAILATKEELDKLNASVRDGSMALEDYLKRVGSLAPSNKSLKVGAMTNAVMLNFEQQGQTLAKYLGTTEGMYSVSSDSSIRKEIADIFVNNASIRGRTTSDNLHLGIVSLNRKAITETGAGTFGKSMSWNAQSQLLANGYSKSNLDLFAQFDRSAVNDAEALVGMTRKHDTLLNKMFEENSSAMQTVMSSSPSERRRLMADAFNYTTDSSVDFYNLNYKPTTGIESVPMIYDESRLFDSYIDTKETGATRSKRINGLLSSIIEADLALKNSTDKTNTEELIAKLERLHNNLSEAAKPNLGGSSGAIKAAMTRTGSHSHLGVVSALSGSVNDFINFEKEAGRHTSYVGVSYHGALDRLRLAGVEMDAEEEAEFLKGNSKYLKDTEGSSNIKRIMVDDTTPLFGLVNREPAQGPMSIRGAEYIVDTSIHDSEKARASVYTRSGDKYYKFFQFGDYDFDSMTEYFSNRGHISNKDILNTTINQSRKLAKDYEELVGFAERLGVKNNKTSKMDSLLDILDKNPAIKTYEDWHNAYLEKVYDDSTKAGLRKTISPKVTMLAAQLNNSLLLATADQSSKEVQAGRVLTHYFVENLLKAQHSSESAGSETVAEKLSRLRAGSNRTEYFSELAKSLTEQLKLVDPSSKDYELGQDAISAILKAERTHMDNTTARNPMEIGGRIANKNLRESLETAEEVLTGRGQATQLHRTTAVEADLADGLKVGYDRFKVSAKQLFNNNKKVLGLSALGLGATALAFRNKPEESYSHTATADVGRESLSSARSDRNPVQGQATQTSSEYVTPHRDAKRAVTVEGDYVNDREDVQYNTQRSLYGDSIDSAQLEYRE